MSMTNITHLVKSQIANIPHKNLGKTPIEKNPQKN